MAKKKWKKRLKKIAKAAIIGGALYAGAKALKKRSLSKAVSGTDDAGIGVTHPALTAKNWITKKDKTAIIPEKKPISKNIFRTRHRITDSAGNTIPSTNKMANIAAMNAPKGIYPPGSVPMPKRKRYTLPSDINQFDYTSRAKGGRIGAKKGGRVTGIAKRGFGRALMKGKK